MGPLWVELTERNWGKEEGYIIVLIIAIMKFNFGFFVHDLLGLIYIYLISENCQLVSMIIEYPIWKDNLAEVGIVALSGSKSMQMGHIH